VQTTTSPLVLGSLAAVVLTFGVAFASGCGVISSKAEVLAGACEGSPYGKDMSADTGDTGFEYETSFAVSLDGDDVIVAINDIDANCCPSPGADIAFAGDEILVDFQDITADEACGCMCVMDFEIRIPDVPPGSYTIDLDYNGEDLTTLEIEVP
jgi:hypothetical protein